jgi:hypothetical protein
MYSSSADFNTWFLRNINRVKRFISTCLRNFGLLNFELVGLQLGSRPPPHRNSVTPQTPLADYSTHPIYCRDNGSEQLHIHTPLCLIDMLLLIKHISFSSATAPSGPGPPHYLGFMITPTHTTLSRTPLDEWSGRRRDLYLAHNTSKRQTFMPPAASNRQPQQASGCRPTS